MPSITSEAIELFNIAFNKNMSLKAFEYKHEANPFKLDIPATFYRDKNKKLISMQWYMGATLNCMGNEILAAQTADTASLESARGFPYLRVFIEGNKVLQEQGVKLRFETPNQNSLPVVTKMDDVFLGNFKIATLDFEPLYKKPSGILGIFSKSPLEKMEIQSLYLREKRKLRFSFSAECLFNEADFSKINGRNNKIFQKRSSKFYKWKVDNFEKTFPNSKQFMYFVIRDERTNELIAYAIVQVLSDVEYKFIDWNIFTNTAKEKQQFLNVLVVETHSFLSMPVPGSEETPKRITKLYVPFINPTNYEEDLFLQCGFEVRDADSFCVRCYEDINNSVTDKKESELDNVTNPKKCIDTTNPALKMENWELRDVDLDYFLNVYA